MQDCDTLLMVGTSFPYSEFLPKEGQARSVQIDIDGKMLGIRYPIEVNLQGDSRETLRKLIPLLNKKTDLKLAGRNREQRQGLVADARRTGDGKRRSDQPAALVLGAFAAFAR